MRTLLIAAAASIAALLGALWALTRAIVNSEPGSWID